MSDYHIKAVILDGCSYSIGAKELLQNHKIKTNFVDVSQSEKDKFKTNMIDTFPQVYLQKNNSKGSLLLGGYTDLKKFIDTFKAQKYNENNVNYFINEKKWSKKAVLRLIQLVN